MRILIEASVEIPGAGSQHPAQAPFPVISHSHGGACAQLQCLDLGIRWGGARPSAAQGILTHAFPPSLQCL